MGMKLESHFIYFAVDGPTWPFLAFLRVRKISQEEKSADNIVYLEIMVQTWII